LLDLWFPAQKPTDISAAQEAINAFYRCGEDAPKKTEDKPPPYSFAADAEAIQAAFQREYHIDLSTVSMHWWRFQALLHGLLGHSFADRVQYRICDIGSIKNKETRSRYQKYKTQYALDQYGQPVRRPTTLEEYNDMLLRQARGEG
jgi:hypothetical protein